MPNGGTLLGWDVLVAPVNTITSEELSRSFGSPTVGDVLQLPRRGDAPYEMAPSLRDVIREALQGKEVSPENISLYLSKLGNLQRYDTSFRQLWALCVSQGKDPRLMSFEEVASWLLKMCTSNSNTARNAYSGLLLVPGWNQLKFCPLIKKCKV